MFIFIYTCFSFMITRFSFKYLISLSSPSFGYVSLGRTSTCFSICLLIFNLIFSFQVLNRSIDPRTYEQPGPLMPQLAQVPLLPQHIITSGTRKDCVRLRGLPYEAQVEHILDFLGDHAKSIVFQGVHMVYNAQVRLSKRN